MPRDRTNHEFEDAWPVDDPFSDFFEEVPEDESFHLGGRCGKAATTIRCKCGSFEFKVGQGAYLTVIKCAKCGIEVCIHAG